MKPEFRRRGNIRDAAAELARLLRKKARAPGRGSGRRRAVDMRQNCVAKMQYSGSIDAHRLQLEKYLAREGTDIDGGKAALFGTDPEEYKRHMDERNFRIFLSPQSPAADCKALAGDFIARLERQTGYKLYWQGAVHHNTAHPHAHLLINGIDKDGKKIDFPPDVVKTFMREAARDICTSQLGQRTEQDLALEREREITAPRFTRLDRTLEERMRAGGRVDLAFLEDPKRVRARLEALRKLKLCSWERGGYRLAEDFAEQLKNNGRYNTFLKAREELRYSAASTLKVYTGAMGELAGRVTKVYRIDGDASDNHAAVLEGLDGKAYFVPFFKKPEMIDRKEKIPLKEGELVMLKTYENQRGRLTPIVFRQSGNQIKGAVIRKGYTGELAGEILRGGIMGVLQGGKEKHGI